MHWQPRATFPEAGWRRGEIGVSAGEMAGSRGHDNAPDSFLILRRFDRRGPDSAPSHKGRPSVRAGQVRRPADPGPFTFSHEVSRRESANPGSGAHSPPHHGIGFRTAVRR